MTISFLFISLYTVAMTLFINFILLRLLYAIHFFIRTIVETPDEEYLKTIQKAF